MNRVRFVACMNECLYLLQNTNNSPCQHCGDYFPKNYQFALSGPWQVFAIAIYPFAIDPFLVTSLHLFRMGKRGILSVNSRNRSIPPLIFILEHIVI